MLSTKSLLLFVLMSIVSLTLCQNDYYSEIEKREARRFCGRHLADALQLVCDGKYNTMFSKKSDSGWMGDNDIFDLNEEKLYMFRPKSQAKALIAQSRFKRHSGFGMSRGVYDECCLKSCSVSEMMGYCATR